VLILIGKFGFASHPFLCARLGFASKLRARDVASVLYHCDLESTFQKHASATAAMKKLNQAYVHPLVVSRFCHGVTCDRAHVT
jgi:hypothetical protein